MLNIEIKDNEQLIYVLYLKDELLHCYDELKYAKNIDSDIFLKMENRLKLLDEAIKIYIQKSHNWFQIKCLEDVIINPQDSCELKTNVLNYNLNDTKIIFDGNIPSSGYLKLSYEHKNQGTGIHVKNIMPLDALETWDPCDYHYNDPTTTKYITPGIFQIKRNTIIGVACSKNKMLVKTIKENEQVNL